MPAERVSMRQIQEVLRLRFASQLPQRAIAKSLGLSQGTVSGYLSRARAAGVSWSLAEDLDDAQLEALLFPPPPAIAADQRPIPDWASVFLALNLQHQDITDQTRKGFYLEIANYLSSCLTYHGLLTHGLKGHSPEWMLGGMINLPTPLIFPLMANNITILTEPALVTAFYDRVNILRDTAEKTLVPKGEPLTPVQMRAAV